MLREARIVPPSAVLRSTPRGLTGRLPPPDSSSDRKLDASGGSFECGSNYFRSVVRAARYTHIRDITSRRSSPREDPLPLCSTAARNFSRSVVSTVLSIRPSLDPLFFRDFLAEKSSREPCPPFHRVRQPTAHCSSNNATSPVRIRIVRIFPPPLAEESAQILSFRVFPTRWPIDMIFGSPTKFRLGLPAIFAFLIFRIDVRTTMLSGAE